MIFYKINNYYFNRVASKSSSTYSESCYLPNSLVIIESRQVKNNSQGSYKTMKYDNFFTYKINWVTLDRDLLAIQLN